MSETVKMLDTLEMVGFLKTNGTASRFVSLTIQTPVVKIRAGNPWHKVSKGEVVGEPQLLKVAKINGLINANFNASVRRKIAEKLGVELSEVEYKNGEVWYQHLHTSDDKPLPLVEHNTKNDGQLYLQYFPHKTETVFVNASGEVIPKETVKPWLYAESERPDFKPQTQVVKLANIRQLKASGVILEMPDFDVAAAALAD